MRRKIKTKGGRNIRFIQNEHRILRALLKLRSIHRGNITARKVAKAAGVSRQTFYNHHLDIGQALTQGTEDLLNEFVAELETQDKNLSKMLPDTNRRIFYAMFIFMDRNGDIFHLICKDTNNLGTLYQMAEAIFPRLQLNWLPAGFPDPDISSERVRLYLFMIVIITAWWGAETNCNVRKADRYIERLLRITKFVEQNKL